MNNPLKEDEKKTLKKRQNMSSNPISNFFVAKDPFKKDDL